MSRGKITRITLGEYTKEIAGDYTINTDYFTMNSGGKGHFSSDKEIIIGEPKEPKPFGKYFKDGWWSSDKEGKNKITEAEIGDTVYFHVEMSGFFPNEELKVLDRNKINFTLYRFDGAPKDINEAPERKNEQKVYYVTWVDKNNDGEYQENETIDDYNTEEVKDKKAVLSYALNLKSLYSQFSTEFTLFLSFTYSGEQEDFSFGNDLYVTPKVKDIYVKLLNYKVSSKVNLALNEINATQQFIRGNDDKQSDRVNMDYFSVRIDEMPKLEGGVKQLYKLIMQKFLTLSKDETYFKGHGLPLRLYNNFIDKDMEVNGLWEFKPYVLKDDTEYAKEQVRKWYSEVGNPIFFIEADSNTLIAKPIVDHGAVIVSEFDEMCWLFTTINTKVSKTQPFSGYRQFGIHQDEDEHYRVFTRAIDRIWPNEDFAGAKNANINNMDATVKDYLSIADGTWTEYMKNIHEYIDELGGCSTIMDPEKLRVNFQRFLQKYNNSPEIYIGNIPQYKYYEK